MKILPKSQRESHRYVSFEVHSDSNISYTAFNKAFMDELTRLVGVIGVAHVRAVVIKDSYAFPKGVIQSSTKGVDVVKATFTQIRHIQSIPCRVNSIRVSGMIHKVK